MSIETVLAGYADAAEDQIARCARIDPARLLSPVADFLPQAAGELLDIGAGPGVNAQWLAGRGHRVTAVEPVRALREAGAARCGPAVRWIDDRLPDLASLGDTRFDGILLSAVWQHLDAGDRAVALPRLAGLLAGGGRLILSLRHGPGAASRPVFPCEAQETLGQAVAAGLIVERQVAAPSVQAKNAAAGVTWTWLVLARP